LLQQYAVDTGQTEPLNNLLGKWGQANDWPDVQELELGPWRPPPLPPGTPDPAQQEMQLERQQAELEMAGQQAELEIKQAEAQLGMETELLKARLQGAQAAQQMALDERKFQQELVQDAALHRQELAQRAAEAALQMRLANAQGQQKLALQKQQAKLQAQRPKAGAKR
jgi:hypothetical protein